MELNVTFISEKKNYFKIYRPPLVPQSKNILFRKQTPIKDFTALNYLRSLSV